MATGYKDINAAKTVIGTLQKWPAKAGGRSPNGPAVAGTTVTIYLEYVIFLVHLVISAIFIIYNLDKRVCLQPSADKLTFMTNKQIQH